MFDGNAYKRFRQAAGLNREQWATEVGKAYVTIRNWETGRTYPNAEYLERSANRFGVSIPDFYTR